MTAYSGNGWVASPEPSDIGIVDTTIAGISIAGGLRGGDVGVVLGYVIKQVNDRVEPLRIAGGYNYRPNVNNPDELSNHASGTAVDYNPSEHGNGLPTTSTWTAGQIQDIHSILAETEGVVRWGGDYHSTPDSMHFEINEDAFAVARIAVKLAGSGGGGGATGGGDGLANVGWGTVSDYPLSGPILDAVGVCPSDSEVIVFYTTPYTDTEHCKLWSQHLVVVNAQAVAQEPPRLLLTFSEARAAYAPRAVHLASTGYGLIFEHREYGRPSGHPWRQPQDYGRWACRVNAEGTQVTAKLPEDFNFVDDIRFVGDEMFGYVVERRGVDVGYYQWDWYEIIFELGDGQAITQQSKTYDPSAPSQTSARQVPEQPVVQNSSIHLVAERFTYRNTYLYTDQYGAPHGWMEEYGAFAHNMLGSDGTNLYLFRSAGGYTSSVDFNGGHVSEYPSSLWVVNEPGDVSRVMPLPAGMDYLKETPAQAAASNARLAIFSGPPGEQGLGGFYAVTEYGQATLLLEPSGDRVIYYPDSIIAIAVGAKTATYRRPGSAPVTSAPLTIPYFTDPRVLATRGSRARGFLDRTRADGESGPRGLDIVLYDSVNAPPTETSTLLASFNYLVQENGWVVDFDATPSTGRIVSYVWDFADPLDEDDPAAGLTTAQKEQAQQNGSLPNAGKRVWHRYQVAPEAYQVTLTVTDADKQTATTTQWVGIEGGSIQGRQLATGRSFSSG